MRRTQDNEDRAQTNSTSHVDRHAPLEADGGRGGGGEGQTHAMATYTHWDSPPSRASALSVHRDLVLQVLGEHHAHKLLRGEKGGQTGREYRERGREMGKRA
jgi:hypothetical protein